MSVAPRPITSVAALIALVVGAALLAAGCGSSTAKTSVSALSFVPKSAYAWVLVDTDFEDGAWKRAWDLARALPQGAALQQRLIADFVGSRPLDYDADIRPWLGAQGGIAVLPGKDGVDLAALAGGGTKGGPQPDTFEWLDITNVTKAQAFLSHTAPSIGSAKDSGFTVQRAKDTSGSAIYWTITGNTLLIAQDAAVMHKALQANVTKQNVGADSSLAKLPTKLGGSNIAYVVGSGDGLRSLLTDSGSTDADTQGVKILRNSARLASIKGFAVGLAAEDTGIHVRGVLDQDSGKLDTSTPRDDDASLLRKLPDGTAFALSGQNLGGVFKQVLDALQKSSPKFTTDAQTLQAAAGITASDIEGAFSGQYAFGLVGSSAAGKAPAVSAKARGAAVTSKAGKAAAATAPAVTSTPTAGFVQQPTDANKATTVIGKLFAFAAASQHAVPKPTSIGSLEGTETSIGASLPLFSASSEGLDLLADDASFITGFTTGSSHLGDDRTFQTVVDAAGVPNQVGTMVYLDLPGLEGIPRVASQLSTVDNGLLAVLGPFVAWTTHPGKSTVTFDLFAQITDRDRSAAAGR